MKPEFQIISKPGFWEKLKGNDVSALSTVRLPIDLNGYWYETCIFYENNVLGRYLTKEVAIDSHYQYERMFKLS